MLYLRAQGPEGVNYVLDPLFDCVDIHFDLRYLGSCWGYKLVQVTDFSGVHEDVVQLHQVRPTGVFELSKKVHSRLEYW